MLLLRQLFGSVKSLVNHFREVSFCTEIRRIQVPPEPEEQLLQQRRYTQRWWIPL